MEHTSSYEPKSSFAKWWDDRLPVMRLMQGQLIDFPTPRNLNYMWTFGGILTFCLAAQIVTGIVLAMHYQPSAHEAFNSVEAIRRDVNYGWMIRNFHAVGASMFFIAVYIHIFRGLYYGSYKAPRGALDHRRDHLPGHDGNGLHGLRAALGPDELLGRDRHHQPVLVAERDHSWCRHRCRRMAVGRLFRLGTTLNRFFSLHYLLPFVLAGLVILHIWALHVAGQNNPTGLDIKTKADAVPMYPYAVAKDAVGMFAFLLLFAWFVFFLPDYLGHADNYIEANPLVTPPHRAGMVLPAVLRHPACNPPRSSAVLPPCSRQSPFWPHSCRGSTRAACARPSTVRSTSGSSGCW